MSQTAGQKKEPTPTEQAKERLNAFRDFQRGLDYKIERINMMEQQLQSVGAGSLDGMPRAPGYEGDRMAEKIARLVDLKKELEDDIAEERRRYAEIKAIADGMKHADERTVIQLRYLDGAKWPAVSAALYGHRDDFGEKADYYLRQTFRKHGTALQSFAEQMTLK